MYLYVCVPMFLYVCVRVHACLLACMHVQSRVHVRVCLAYTVKLTHCSHTDSHRSSSDVYGTSIGVYVHVQA